MLTLSTTSIPTTPKSSPVYNNINGFMIPVRKKMKPLRIQTRKAASQPRRKLTNLFKNQTSTSGTTFKIQSITTIHPKRLTKQNLSTLSTAFTKQSITTNPIKELTQNTLSTSSPSSFSGSWSWN